MVITVLPVTAPATQQLDTQELQQQWNIKHQEHSPG